MLPANFTKAIVISLYLCLFASKQTYAAEPDLNELLNQPEVRTKTTEPLYSSFNDLNSSIRDGRIDKIAAQKELFARLSEISADYHQRGGRDYLQNEWFFPVAGYNAGAIDKGRSHGFVASGYDFFSGNRHGGHPAYDIFIRDRNQDSLDDRNGKAVQVVSMTGGVVVALEKEWQPDSKLRGGKYIWIYDPANKLLVYYAHNEKLFVELGNIVKPGDLLATMGRSGLNAAKRRSPTHLHLSVLNVKNGQPTPLNIYRYLQQAQIMSLK